MLRHADGTEDVLVDAGDGGAVLNPQPSLDATWVYYSWCPDVRLRATNTQVSHTNSAYLQGCDLYKIAVASREVVRLTWQTWTPTPGVAPWSNEPLRAVPAGTAYPGYGVFNTGPCPLPDGRLLFTSSRNGLVPPKHYTFPTMQLFVLDERCQDAHGHPCVEQVGFLNLGSALHPVLLTDGRIMWSSYQAQGLRDKRLWALWASYPDGRFWEPLMSAFRLDDALHWQAQRTGGDIAVVEYYLANNWGFGKLLGFPLFDAMIARPRWGSPVPTDPSNPPVGDAGRTIQYPFSPVGLYSPTPWTNSSDTASPVVDGTFQGKVTQPSVGPANTLLVVYSPGPVNKLLRPTNLPRHDAGIYVLPARVAELPAHLQLVVNDPAYNEQQPKALVPYQSLYGLTPPVLPWVPNDGTLHAALPAGTPYGLIGTSSLIKRNTAPGVLPANWWRQGADVLGYPDSEIYAIRLVLTEPTSQLKYGPGGAGKPHWRQGSQGVETPNERLRILGEIPVRKRDAQGQVLLDIDGHADTSFLAMIPANVPFTFQTLDPNGRVLNMSQTWHQLRPGEVRTDCGGCHAHAQVGTPFRATAAGQPGFVPTDLTQQALLLTPGGGTVRVPGPVDVEYHRDLKPILDRRAPLLAALTPTVLTQQHTKPFQSRLSALPGLLTDATPEEQLTVARWIDLASPVDDGTPYGWFAREIRPTLTMRVHRQPITCPAGCVPTQSASVLQVGLASVYQDVTGAQLHVTLDGTDVTAQLVPAEGSPGVWTLPLQGTGQGLMVATVCPAQGPCDRPRAERRLAAQW